MTEDIVIVGGGPAGAAAACILAESGRAPLLLERDRGPRDKICGEFLSWEAQDILACLGIDLDALGATRMAHLRIASGRRVAEIALPFTARGLSRRVMDAALLARAETLGAGVRRGVTVKGIDGDKLDIGTKLRADRILLASGKHDVRGAKRDDRGTVTNLVGFKTYFALAPAQQAAIDGHIEIALFDGGYAGLQLVEGGRANLCLLVEDRLLAAAGRDWTGLLPRLKAMSPHLAERLDGATERLARPLAIAGVPYGFRHAGGSPPRLYRAGDQLAVIPSFSGDGMSIALATGCAAARAILHDEPADAFHKRMAQGLATPLTVAGLLYRIGRHATGRDVILGAARRWPALARTIIGLTRVPLPLLDA